MTTVVKKANSIAEETESNPMDQIKIALTEANKEREKINKNIKKRKREASESNQSIPLPPRRQE